MMPYREILIFSVQLVLTYENYFNLNFLKWQKFSAVCQIISK